MGEPSGPNLSYGFSHLRRRVIIHLIIFSGNTMNDQLIVCSSTYHELYKTSRNKVHYASVCCEIGCMENYLSGNRSQKVLKRYKVEKVMETLHMIYNRPPCIVHEWHQPVLFSNQHTSLYHYDREECARAWMH